jgi:hypothetical protein
LIIVSVSDLLSEPQEESITKRRDIFARYLYFILFLPKN